MRVVGKRQGQGASVRSPAAVATAAKLHMNQAVEVGAERGRIIIEPVPKSAFELHELVAGITDENRHAETDFGKAIGNETS